MNKYSIVIPIKRYTYFWSSKGHIDDRKNTKQHDNIKRFFDISWKTHEQNLKKEDIDCIFFITVKDEKDYLTDNANKHIKGVNKQIITEDELLNPIYDFKSHRKQMLLKLLICEYIKTELYLVLDDDIISLKKFEYSDLFSKNKIRYAAERSIETQPYVWKASRDLLKLENTKISSLRNTISVTPEIMITSVVKDMMNYLMRIYRDEQELYDVMMKISWTEYTVYWLYLRYIDKKGIKYYYVNDPLTNVNLMDYNKNYVDIIKSVLDKKEKHFMIIQSNVYECRIKEIKEALTK